MKFSFSGLLDESVVVRNAALFALGQYSEHVQVYIFIFYFISKFTRFQLNHTEDVNNVLISQRHCFGDNGYLEKAIRRTFNITYLYRFLQPEAGKYHAEVLPPLREFLNTVICDENRAVNHRGTLTKLFYAIEKFTEGLG